MNNPSHSPREASHSVPELAGVAESADASPFTRLSQIQFAFLAIVSCVMLLIAPTDFNFQPDSGIYIGGADSIVTQGSYSFNGLPILVYYPGFSLLLALPISVFGVDFHVLHIFAAAWTVASLWLLRAYYSDDRYAAAGLIAPAILPFTGIFQQQVVYVLSSGTFLALTIAALLLWQLYEASGRKRYLIACAVIVGFSPLVRYQGLFLAFAFGIALAFRFFDTRAILHSALRVGAIMLAVSTPFILWTIRNYFEHTTDTYSMFNRFFFGLESLALYSADSFKVDWIDTRWKYGVYNFLYSIRDLVAAVFGKSVAELVRLELQPILIAIPLALGIRPWWKRATHFERVYVLTSAVFFVWWSLRASNLHTIPRYWVPLVPFVLIIGALGMQSMYELISRPKPRAWFQAILLSLTVLIVANGTESAVSKLLPWADQYYEQSNRSRLAIAEYIERNTDPTDVVAVTDWGVLPLSIARRSVAVFDDKDRIRSLRAIVDNRATHLAILESTSVMVGPAQEMVSELPHVFHSKLALAPQGPGAEGAVYEIDLGQATLELEKRKGATN